MDVIDAYLYIKRFIAQSDGATDAAEWRRIVAELREDIAALGLPAAAIPDALERLERRFVRLHDHPAAAVAEFRHCVGFLRDALAAMPAARRRIIEQLWDLAAADGWIDDMETHFIAQAERDWQ